jgi:preprotein translocase subunit SecF
VYALAGLEVTPATVIGVLTILGYSLYDTVVVFDKVRENTVGLEAGSRMTYSEAANLAVNQTLIRSINTSVAALLPVGAILGVGAGLLGAGTLRDLSLALFVGMLAGTYSSIFLATPLLAHLKEQEPAMRALRTRVEARRRAEAERAHATRTAAAGAGAAAGTSAGPAAAGQPGSQPDSGQPGGIQSEDVTASSAAPDLSSPAPSARRPTGGSRAQPRRGPQRRPSGKRRR